MDLAALLSEAPLFAELNRAELEQLAGLAEQQHLHCGQQLYAAGGLPDYFYLVISGRLRISHEGKLVNYVGRLEPVGEIGIVTGDVHAADVHAVRDTRLLRFARNALLELLTQQAPTLLNLMRLTLGRMKQDQSQRRLAANEGHGTIAVIPASPGLPLMTLAESLLRHWTGWPEARLITSRHVDAALGEGAAQTAFQPTESNHRLVNWLHDMELRHRYVIYVADNAEDGWALRCLRHADRVLMLAEANQEPAPLPVLTHLPTSALLAPVELVLLRPEGDPSPHTHAWRLATAARAHYFVHPWSETDLAALAAQVSGHGIGLVLGGGGARGFAHIGLIRALEQLQVPIHVMGGTSMGAFVAALMACGYDSVEIAHIARETFVNNNYLNDYIVPRVSLIQGRRFLKRLEVIFGDRRIEDLRRSYYCMSTSLTTGSSIIHDYGAMAMWVGTSMAIPGIAPPIAYKGELLCDGGVVDNLPTDVMQGLERGAIIASSVSSKGLIKAPGPGGELPDPYALLQKENRLLRPSIREIIMRTATLTSDTVIQRESAKRADIFINMPVGDINLFGWKHLDTLVERGYEQAMEQLAPLREKLISRDWDRA